MCVLYLKLVNDLYYYAQHTWVLVRMMLAASSGKSELITVCQHSNEYIVYKDCKISINQLDRLSCSPYSL